MKGDKATTNETKDPMSFFKTQDYIASIEDQIFKNLTTRISFLNSSTGEKAQVENRGILKRISDSICRQEIGKKVDLLSQFEIKRIEDKIYN